MTYDFILLIVRYHKSKLAICCAFPNKQNLEERMAAQQAPAFEKGKRYNLPIIDIKPDPDQPRKDKEAYESPMVLSLFDVGYWWR